ncbi:hypothetical protein E2C01_060524 [Portunus trituberculatus]|uniref:Uncharacterized protein n=1 Tax=Portunus trituberculatus TaxID=210409 RepID=A0A5B7HAQ5_PORTR|nr:hypothetical protein [Portunus trituberculatus]
METFKIDVCGALVSTAAPPPRSHSPHGHQTLNRHKQVPQSQHLPQSPPRRAPGGPDAALHDLLCSAPHRPGDRHLASPPGLTFPV